MALLNRRNDAAVVRWSPGRGTAGRPGALVLVPGRRERVTIARVPELAHVDLAAELRSLLLVGFRLADAHRLRRRVRCGRHLIGIEVVKARLDALLLGELGEPVVVQALRGAAMLVAVPVELRAVLVLVRASWCHRSSLSWCRLSDVTSMPPWVSAWRQGLPLVACGPEPREPAAWGCPLRPSARAPGQRRRRRSAGRGAGSESHPPCRGRPCPSTMPSSSGHRGSRER